MSERQGEQLPSTKTEKRSGVAVNSEAVPPQGDRASREQAKGDFLSWSEHWLDPKATDGLYAEARAFLATGRSVGDFSIQVLKGFSEKAWGVKHLPPANRAAALERLSHALADITRLSVAWERGWRQEFRARAEQYIHNHQADVCDALESGESAEAIEERLLQEFSIWMQQYPLRERHDVLEFEENFRRSVLRNIRLFSDWMGRRDYIVYRALERGEPYEKIVEEHLRRGRERRGRFTALFFRQSDERQIRAVCEAALRRFNATQEK